MPGANGRKEALDRMLSGLAAFATGRITRGSALPTADLTVRKLAAIDALSRHGRARARMLDTIEISPSLWPTSALIDWIGILKRVEERAARRARATEGSAGLLRARLNFQGTVMTFSTERTDALWWLMVSADVNANRALIAVLDEPGWREDVGRMVRGSAVAAAARALGHHGRQRLGHGRHRALRRSVREDARDRTDDDRARRRSVPVSVAAQKQTREFEWPAAKRDAGGCSTGATARRGRSCSRALRCR